MPPWDTTLARPWLSLAETGVASKVRREQETAHRLVDLIGSYSSSQTTKKTDVL